jgi:hypothetical protein
MQWQTNILTLTPIMCFSTCFAIFWRVGWWLRMLRRCSACAVLDCHRACYTAYLRPNFLSEPPACLLVAMIVPEYHAYMEALMHLLNP